MSLISPNMKALQLINNDNNFFRTKKSTTSFVFRFDLLIRKDSFMTTLRYKLDCYLFTLKRPQKGTRRLQQTSKGKKLSMSLPLPTRKTVGTALAWMVLAICPNLSMLTLRTLIALLACFWFSLNLGVMVSHADLFRVRYWVRNGILQSLLGSKKQRSGWVLWMRREWYGFWLLFCWTYV